MPGGGGGGGLVSTDIDLRAKVFTSDVVPTSRARSAVPCATADCTFLACNVYLSLGAPGRQEGPFLFFSGANFLKPDADGCRFSAVLARAQ